MFVGLLSFTALGQSANPERDSLRGTVTLGGKRASRFITSLITILQLKRTVDTDDNGKYEIQGVPPGKYDVVAHLDRVPDTVGKTVDLTSGQGTQSIFRSNSVAYAEDLPSQQQAQSKRSVRSIQSVDVLGSVELAKKNPVSLGEALDGELGRETQFRTGHRPPSHRRF